jgi:hypothetical protein
LVKKTVVCLADLMVNKMESQTDLRWVQCLAMRWGKMKVMMRVIHLVAMMD